MNTKILFVDLQLQYQNLKAELDLAIATEIARFDLIDGQSVREFEQLFGRYLRQSSFVIACANGSDALEILLKAHGIGPGDQVIVPAVSWVASAAAVCNVGAEPVFADIDNFYTLDARAAQACISARTKAILAVHLYGQMADMRALGALARAQNILLLEDAAQAHGAQLHNKKAGLWGDGAIFSFYPTKNLGAMGDAGAIICPNAELDMLCRRISNHGQARVRHEHNLLGRNSRMDSLQAAILKVKLRYLDEWNQQRNLLASRYTELLADLPIACPHLRPDSDHVFHVYVIQTAQRLELQNFLAASQIISQLHYPQALPFLPCFSHLPATNADKLPNAVLLSTNGLSLPIFPELTFEQQDRIIEQIRLFFG